MLCNNDDLICFGIRLVKSKARKTPYNPKMAPDAPALFTPSLCHQRLARLAKIPLPNMQLYILFSQALVQGKLQHIQEHTYSSQDE